MALFLSLLLACSNPSDLRADVSDTTPAEESDSETFGTYEWYPDADRDGSGDASVEPIIASGVSGSTKYVSNKRDCDDTTATVHPGATELCNDVDDDTDVSLNPGVDTDRDGYSVCDDCDDYERTAYPDAAEVINGIDDNCDGTIDEVAAE